MAAFACVTPASLLTLQPPDNFAIDAMDHAGGVCVGGLGVAAMVSQSANGLGSGSGIVDSTSRLPVAGAYVRLGAHSGLKSDIARGPKSATSGLMQRNKLGAGE